MRRPLVALVIAALAMLGGATESTARHDAGLMGTAAVRETTSVARVAIAAVPAPQSSVPPFLLGLAVLAAAAAFGAARLGYVARQRGRAVLIPVLTSAVRLRGPPAPRVPG